MLACRARCWLLGRHRSGVESQRQGRGGAELPSRTKPRPISTLPAMRVAFCDKQHARRAMVTVYSSPLNCSPPANAGCDHDDDRECERHGSSTDGVSAVGLLWLCPRLGCLPACFATDLACNRALRMERVRHRTKSLLGHRKRIRVALRARTVIGAAVLITFTRSLGEPQSTWAQPRTRRVSACRRPPAPVAQAQPLQRRMQSTFSLARVSALLQGYLHDRACIASRD
jgi:hypothetical protein